MQRIAVPMIGGTISSTLLTLIVIPAIIRWKRARGLERCLRGKRSPDKQEPV
jgi:Cu/Ag efflux pump CusA